MLSWGRHSFRERQPSTRPGSCSSTFRDPSRILGRCRYQHPRAPRNLRACRTGPNVVFPSGLVAKKTDAEGFALRNPK